MEKWAGDNDAVFNHFFRYISFNKAVALIRNGKISPWTIYNCKTGMDMLEKMSNEQLGLLDDFIKVLKKIDILYILDIYPAGEKPIKNINSINLVKKLKKKNNNIFYLRKKDNLKSHLQDHS